MSKKPTPAKQGESKVGLEDQRPLVRMAVGDGDNLKMNELAWFWHWCPVICCLVIGVRLADQSQWLPAICMGWNALLAVRLVRWFDEKRGS